MRRNNQQGNMKAAVEERPFDAVEISMGGVDLEKLAVIPGLENSSKKSNPCGFRLDGRPCKLCGEDEEQEESICEPEKFEKSSRQEVLLQAPQEAQPESLPDANVAERKHKLLASAPVKRGRHKTQQPTSKQLPPEAPSPFSNDTDAYERKKQRAKQTRVQLNDALERLGRAMEHATDDSQRRLAQLENLFVLTPLPKSLPHLEQSQKHPKCYHKTIIDRPTFVRAAVKILNGMNQHCEALAQEVLRLKVPTKQPQGTTTAVEPKLICNSKGSLSTSCCSNKRKSCGSSSGTIAKQHESDRNHKRCCH